MLEKELHVEKSMVKHEELEQKIEDCRYPENRDVSVKVDTQEVKRPSTGKNDWLHFKTEEFMDVA